MQLVEQLISRAKADKQRIVTNDTLRGIGSRQEVQRERGFHTGREGGVKTKKSAVNQGKGKPS